jgi:hypothetical protein
LIYLAIAIASDGNDAVGKGIKFLCNGLWVVPFGDAITRTEVKKVPKEEEHVTLFAIEVGYDLIKGGF